MVGTLPALRATAAVALVAAALGAGSPADWPAIFDSWPTETPNQGWPDGPILGNGNIGLSIGGSDGSITLYMTVHGFWSSGYGSNSTMPPMGRPSGADSFNADAAVPPLGFPGCPAANCSITVGMLIGAVEISSPELAGGSWRGTMWLNNASASITLTGAGGAAVTVSAYVTATDQLAVVSVVNTGAIPLTKPLNVTTYANTNTAGVPVDTGCVGSDGKPSPCPAPGSPNAVMPGTSLRKAANAGPSAVIHVDGVLATRVLPLGGGSNAPPAALSTAPFVAYVPATNWATGAKVNTANLGYTSMVDPRSLAPGGGFVLAASVCASQDPLVVPRDPSDAATAWLSAVEPSTGIDALWTAHTAWWETFWSASAISLDASEADTEAFWWTAVYALGSGSRAGQLVMDLWSPWRTSDYPLWRSNPTTDYNFQAVVAGAVAVNHPELATPSFDFLSQQLARGGPQLESASLGCPNGVHASVDLAPWGLKMGVWGEAQDWGILTNAAYASVNYLYQFYSTPLNASWVEGVAWPWLVRTAAFWECRLIKTPVAGAPDGYLYFDACDCSGDEGCKVSCDDGSRDNPMWYAVYVRRLLQGLIDMAVAVGKAPDVAWTDILAHMPPVPTTRTARGAPVLAWYGGGTTNWDGQSNNLHALWPGELLGLSEQNATLLDAALGSFNLTAWTQANSFNWVHSAAARAGVPPSGFLSHWHASLTAHARPNRLIAWSGACSDTLGAAQFPVDMLVQWNLLPQGVAEALGLHAHANASVAVGAPSHLRLFPAWPSNLTASFTQLRMRGALLVSATYDPSAAAARALGPGASVASAVAAGLLGAHLPAGGAGGVTAVSITSEAGAPVTLLSPWPGTPQASILVCEQGGSGGSGGCPAGSAPVASVTWAQLPGTHGGDLLAWPTTAGGRYEVILQASA